MGSSFTANPAIHLRQEYEVQQRLLQGQTPLVQRFLEGQARVLAGAIMERPSQVRFQLPDRVASEASDRGEGKQLQVPADQREQMVGGLMDRLARTDIRLAVRQRLLELEQSTARSISVAAQLTRHATVMYIVHTMLPAGRTVSYTSADGEEIPSIPLASPDERASAITASTDAIVEESGDEAGRGELLVPYVPYARRFYLPQWVAFDEEGKLLVNSIDEAEADVGSMQNFLEVLHAAVALAPYMVADLDYQQKRYGMLGQLINQGRALARYETDEIIRTIQLRASANDLNRGLSLSLPYFDDQELRISMHNFEVIPAGRIMFVPAFVVRAAREEQVKVAQDTRLSPSTRKHLLEELKRLEGGFERFTIKRK